MTLPMQLFAACAEKKFFGLNPWYHYINQAGKMELDSSGRCGFNNNIAFPGDIALIALSILDMLLRIAGLVAIGFIIYGGIKLVTAQGDPDGLKKARQTIFNALIGLVIALFATTLVAFVGTRLS